MKIGLKALAGVECVPVRYWRWSLAVLAADLGGVFYEGEAVEPRGAGVAEQQVELPPPVDVIPVVGELLSADFVLDEPGPFGSRCGAFDVCRSLGGGRAFGVSPDVFGPGDDGLAAGVPPVVDRPVVVAVVVVVEGLRNAYKRRRGLGIWAGLRRDRCAGLGSRHGRVMR